LKISVAAKQFVEQLVFLPAGERKDNIDIQ
jgi:hypothetical protein